MDSNSNEKIVFEIADISQSESLARFCVDSNDIYKTRKVNSETAQSILSIPEQAFADNTIEILKNGTEIVGICGILIRDSTDCEITHIFVKAGLQRKGYGTALFRRAVEIAKRKGVTLLSWISDPDSIDFYIKMGAECVGIEENLLNPDVPLGVFNLNIDTIDKK
jgi:GNAT superfamily N-acetyltransferase